MRTRIFDTSSIIEIKQVPRIVRPRIFSALDRLVADDLLFFPAQVLGELGRFTDSKTGKQDECFEWAKRAEAEGTRHGLLLDEAKAVLSRIPNLVDPEKVPVAEVDEADPYVIALAVKLMGAGRETTIITEDKNPKPRRTPLSDAAGVFHVPSMGLRTFVIFEENIWDGEEGT